MISTDNFSKIAAGFNIVGCTVRRRDFLYLLLREDYTQWTDFKEEGEQPGERHLEKRMVPIILSKPDPWSWAGLNGFARTVIGASTKPEEKGVMATLDGQVYASGGGSMGVEADLPRDENGLRAGFSRLKAVDGYLFACGPNRSLGVREGTGRWRWHSAAFDYPATVGGSTLVREPSGFADLDGFAPDDIYLVGGRGDVWHFNGKTARRIDFPSNLPLFSVCCGGDGQVYVAGFEGAVFVGRGDKWREVKTRTLAMPLMQMAWYDDKVWATNDTGVWWIDKDGFREAEIPVEARVCAGYLSAGDGVLLLGGRNGAAFLSDGKWTQLYSYEQMMQRCETEGKLDGVLRARWQEFSPRAGRGRN